MKNNFKIILKFYQKANNKTNKCTKIFNKKWDL